MVIVDSELCSRCKGRGFCGQTCPILNNFKFHGKIKTHFSGSSPPEIFVGRYNYPNVNTGILSPQEHGKTEQYNMPELWHAKKLGIPQILQLRSKLIYGRFKSNIKDARKERKFIQIMQEIAIADKNVSTEFFLKRAPTNLAEINSQTPIIGNPAPLKKARLEENPHVNKKVDYLVYDTDVKSAIAIEELYNSNIAVTNIMKILSAGLLGLKSKRKLVPTRWSITSTDDTISKFLLDKIRYYPEISEFHLFNSEYLGNHYEFLLLPDKFSFEVIEAKLKGSVWNPSSPDLFMQDYEGFNGRKKYADNVTGAYYANRLALAEYLDKKKRQASCLVMREAKPEYYAPCGVGILREASRQAFKSKPEIFSTIKEALNKAQTRMKLNINQFTNKSWLLKEFGKQKRLSEF